jgi:hypothetical protein
MLIPRQDHRDRGFFVFFEHGLVRGFAWVLELGRYKRMDMGVLYDSHSMTSCFQ